MQKRNYVHLILILSLLLHQLFMLKLRRIHITRADVEWNNTCINNFTVYNF
jgi:hypothetical protein